MPRCRLDLSPVLASARADIVFLLRKHDASGQHASALLKAITEHNANDLPLLRDMAALLVLLAKPKPRSFTQSGQLTRQPAGPCFDRDNASRQSTHGPEPYMIANLLPLCPRHRLQQTAQLPVTLITLTSVTGTDGYPCCGVSIPPCSRKGGGGCCG